MLLWSQILLSHKEKLTQGAPWRQFRFENGSVYDEVTDSEMTLFGAATVSDGMLRVTTANTANYAEFNHVTFDANEDFYIRATFSSNAPSGDGYQQTILGQYTSNAGISSWKVTHCGPSHPLVANRNKISFIFKDSESTIHTVPSSQVVSYTDLHTVEVVRKNGTITVYIDGVAGESVYAPLGNPKYNYPKNRVFRYASTSTTMQGGGRRDDIQIIKGAFDFTPGIKPALPKYVRPEYSVDDADAMILQLGFRRGSKLCEINDTPIQLNGTATIGRDARLTQTNVSTSYAQIPIPYFGAGDFTIEFMVNFSDFHAQYGVALGHYQSTNTNDENNRWAIGFNTAGAIWFAMFTSPSEHIAVASPSGLFELNRDNHIVVERVGTVTTIYLNGKPVAQSDALNFPMRGGPGVFTTTSMNRVNHFAGSIWNIRIADKALYKIDIPWYVGKTLALDGNRVGHGTDYNGLAVTMSNIVNRKGDLIFTANPLSVLDIASATLQPAARNFEIHMEFTLDSTPKSTYLFALGGGANIAWSSIQMHIRTDGRMHFGGSYSNTRYDVGGDTEAGVVGTVTFGARTKVVVQRVGTTLNFYVNDVLTKTFTGVGTFYNSSARPLRIGRLVNNPGSVSVSMLVGAFHKFYYNLL